MLESIIKSLSVDSNQGSFCTSMTTPTHDLQLSIKNLGEIKFPLKAKMVRALIQYAKPAKFGWRDQTVYDSSVRHVWEISKNQIQISNAQWEQTLNPSIDEIRKNLGLSKETKLSAYLHNLLIYEPGQFRDIISQSRKSGDWSIKTNLNCKCSLCKQLNAFLLKSNEIKLVWPLAKEGRQHIHSIIEDMMLPVTHITERKGSPYKLILTKTKALHTQEARRRQKAMVGLQKLEAII